MTPPLSPRRVPAKHGWSWVRQGWQLCRRKPLTWIVYTVLTWGMIRATSIHPLLVAGAAVLLPVILAGWTLACREAEAGRPIPVTMLFDGFRARVADLASIGALNLVGNLVLMLVLVILGGEAFTQAMTNPGSLSPEQAHTLRAQMLLPLALIVGLGVPMAMAVWFAPLAVILGGHRGPAALLSSLRGIALNPVSFSLYSAVIGGAGAALFFLAQGLGLSPPDAMETAFWILMPLLMTSVYASYRDIFGAGGTTADTGG